MDRFETTTNLIEYCLRAFQGVPDSVLQATIQVVTAFLQADCPTATATQAIGFEYYDEEETE